MATHSVFVCGVTGVQGGALARELLAQGVSVHAVTRDPSSPKAIAVQNLGVKVWHGDFDNHEALQSALKGTQSVFLNLVPNFSDPTAEIRQAKLIIQLAKAAGVSHLVQGSGIGFGLIRDLLADEPESILTTMIEGKHAIEAEVRNAGFPTFTIMRPGNFMTNYLDPFVRAYTGLAETGRWTSAVLPETALPMVDRKTMGAFTSAAILDPVRFNGKEVIYADEVITVAEILQKLGKAAGKKLEVITLSDDEVATQKGQNPFLYVQYAMRRLHENVDLDQVRSWCIPLSSFDAFVEREKEAIQTTYAGAPSIS